MNIKIVLSTLTETSDEKAAFEKKLRHLFAFLKKMHPDAVSILWVKKEGKTEPGTENIAKTDWLFSPSVLDKIVAFLQKDAFGSREDDVRTGQESGLSSARQSQTTVALFYGDYEGIYLGCQAAQALRKNCHTDVTGWRIDDDRLQVVKKIFNARVDGVFPLGDDVVIVSPAAGTAGLTGQEEAGIRILAKGVRREETGTGALTEADRRKEAELEALTGGAAQNLAGSAQLAIVQIDGADAPEFIERK